MCGCLQGRPEKTQRRHFSVGGNEYYLVNSRCVHEYIKSVFHLEFDFFVFTSGDLKAVLTVHHAFVDPHAVPSFHMTQSAVTHLTLPETQANRDTR